MNKHDRSFRSRAYKPPWDYIEAYCPKCWFRSWVQVSNVFGKIEAERELKYRHDRQELVNCSETLQFI